ncbi:DUF1064 domain-containing protein [Clostridium botulinum]|uniref:DUF1064 domain-containing protein n=1 Tax=Clostridium botulinum TaxID=1491 RepID=UPI001967C903|nr:DUF1064 domain-containing protein [Clostridium botulinum]MBN1074637.1 DUF1064 domain-containing protein [Clostridium botulinum]
MAYSKYKNKKVEKDGFKFDSQLERDYYDYLNELKEKGIVKDFQMQVKYLLQDSFQYKEDKIRKIEYKADYVVQYTDEHEEVVDIKPNSLLMIRPEFKLKRKLLIYKYPNIDFRCITRKGRKPNYEWFQIL